MGRETTAKPNLLVRTVPHLSWLANCDRGWLGPDFIAGLTVVATSSSIAAMSFSSTSDLAPVRGEEAQNLLERMPHYPHFWNCQKRMWQTKKSTA